MLRVEIAGEWAPEDFIEVLLAFESLYYSKLRDLDAHKLNVAKSFISAIQNIDPGASPSNDVVLREVRGAVSLTSRLRLNRVHYASPGAFDFAGVGEAIKALHSIIETLLKYITGKEIRRQEERQAAIETDRKATQLKKEHQEYVRLALENLKSALEINREFPDYDISSILEISGGEIISKYIVEGRITGVTSQGSESLEAATFS